MAIPKYRIIISPRAKKQLKKIPAFYQDRIIARTEALADNPYIGKKLEGKLSQYYAIRVWPYRIVYLIKNKLLIVEVILIGHRKDIYQR